MNSPIIKVRWERFNEQFECCMKQSDKVSLPIDSHIDEILNAIRDYSTIIVKASPGSGKTTRLPWAIAEKLSKNVVVLEPRRLAAKLAAQRIAEEEKLGLGTEVGYHFRFEKNVTPDTKLIFYTEGTFLKRFLGDKNLSGTDVVILDEFHERHLDTDLALAFLRDLQSRRNLKIVIMSATLDLELLKTFPDSKSIEINAPHFPVEISYLPNQPSILNQTLEQKVKKAVDTTEGDSLVFLPGMREMIKVQNVLDGNYDVFLLHADLSKEEQARALLSSQRRKIILATNIAESSVTIPGITVVIDSGIQREAWYSPWNGLKFIVDQKVTKSSAIQRAGRAGRTGPGMCLRLYSQQDFQEREDHTVPEIERADLADVCLLVQGTGLTPLWFCPPPHEKWKKSQELLTTLGALNTDGSLTSIGKEMLHFPLYARLSRVLLEGQKLTRKGKESLLQYICQDIEKDRSGTLRRRLSFYLNSEGTDDSHWEKTLLSGFIDQVAKFRSKQRDFIHYSGKILKAHSSLSHLEEGYYIILDITQRQEAVQVIEVLEEWLWEVEPFPFTEEDDIKTYPAISLIRKTKLGSIVVEESSMKSSWSTLTTETKKKIIEQSKSIIRHEADKWKETPKAQRLMYWAKMKDKHPEEIIESITAEDYFSHEENLNWENFQTYLQHTVETKLEVTDLERELPSKIDLGGRRELTVHYPHGMEPYLEAPIQDFYGLESTPMIMNGKVPLTLKLLGPHKRPIQITRDLKNFWSKTYQEMKKEYQRDYPRHYWPDKPWEAKPYLLKSHLPKV